MMHPNSSAALSLLVEVAPPTRFQKWINEQPRRFRQGIYSPAVVIWLMMFQRLEQRGTLSLAVGELAAGGVPEQLLVCCKRVREQRISLNTSGYARARQQLPMSIVENVHEHVGAELKEWIEKPDEDLPGPAYLLDGSSLQLSASPELRRLYPPASNQHGCSHWPVLRVVVAHEMKAGLAMRPCWGAMYGPAAVSEQQLAEQVMNQLPVPSVVVGDRNFGIFAIAYAAQRHGHEVLLRLTESRARRLTGQSRLPTGQEWDVIWRPTRDDRRGRPQLPAEAAVAGRVVVCAVPGWRPIYLFTTLSLPPERLVQLYAARWNIEVDLRSLKQVVQLDRITAHSNNVMEKELLLAISAYNLVRVVMALAARAAGIELRRLSFTRVLYLLQSFLRQWHQSPEKQAEGFARLVQLATQCRLPNRSHRPGYPREVWGRGYRYPHRKQ
jgi:hypothetical protein